MFWYSIEGRVADLAELERQHQCWLQDVAPGARGWLGNTSGVTDEGFGFLVARFTDAAAAQATSERAEQSRWWQATEPCFVEGSVDFLSWDNVQPFLRGGSDNAGFVQVIRGRAIDVELAKTSLDALASDVYARCPEVIGGLVGIRPDGDFAQIVYFTSEEEAREGEALSGEGSLDFLDGTPNVLDLRDPWLAGASR